jgi:hypothetical protein
MSRVTCPAGPVVRRKSFESVPHRRRTIAVCFHAGTVFCLRIEARLSTVENLPKTTVLHVLLKYADRPSSRAFRLLLHQERRKPMNLGVN